MSVINSTPERKFGAYSLRIIVGLETHRLREESAFIFRGPPLRLVRPFRRSHDGRPRRAWKSNGPFRLGASFIQCDSMIIIINRRRKLTCVNVSSVRRRRPDRAQRFNMHRPSSLVGPHQSQLLGLQSRGFIY